MCLEDALAGTSETLTMQEKPIQRKPQLPEDCYSVKWLCENHPIHYEAWLCNRGHDPDHINRQMETYRKHFYQIAYEVLSSR